MNEPNSKSTNGALAICIASALWGLGYFLRKLILDSVSPILLAFLTAAIVSITLWLIFRFKAKALMHSFRKHPGHYLGLALTGVALGSSFMFLALRELDLGTTTLLEKLQPILVFVFARIFLKERFPVKKRSWILLALLSSYFLVAKNPLSISFHEISLLGIMGIVGAASSWALGTVIGKSVADQSVPSEHITFFRFFFGALLLLPLFLFRDSFGLTVDWSFEVMAIIVIAAILSTTLGYYLFYKGLQSTSAGISGVLELVTPITGMILGALFLNERMTFVQYTSAALLLLSAYSLVKPKQDC